MFLKSANNSTSVSNALNESLSAIAGTSIVADRYIHCGLKKQTLVIFSNNFNKY